MTQALSHYEEHVQRDVNRLRGKVTDMAGLAERALQDTLRALLDNNRQLAYLVVLRDQHIDELEKEIDRLCLEFIVRNQPVAGLLRFVYVAMKINQELERIGDYAESIARQVLKITSVDTHFLHPRFSEIANLAVPMLHDAVQAFLNQNAELARRTMETEVTVDGLRDQINSELIKAQAEGRFPLEALTPLMTIARRYERVSDQAKNICEEALYLCTGEYAKHQGVDVFRILFVDQHNSCLSQMAEAIGHSLGQEKFMFSSAGVHLQPLDPGLVAFMSDKGMDVTHQTAKTLQQVPNLEFYQVFVSFDQVALKALTPAPAKGVGLDWAMAEPDQTQGTAEEIRASYEAAYNYISTHIRDLVQAILGIDLDPAKINGK